MTVPTLAIVQARMGSSRLPGKVLKPILGRPMLWYVVERVRGVSAINQVVVATSDLLGDEPIRAFCRAHDIAVFSGSHDDVLDRFYRTAKTNGGNSIVRITADCPFVDPETVGRLIDMFETGRYDHVGVATGAGAAKLDFGRFPDGLDAECFSFAALERAWNEASHRSDREHVTPYIWRNRHLFRCGMLTSREDYSHLRWTVDNETDFQVVSAIYEALYRAERHFLMADILAYLSENPSLMAANQSSIGREGYLELWDTTGDQEVRRE